MLKEVELGASALSFIRESLSAGGTLAESLMRLPIEDGRVTTLVPATASEEMLGKFMTGGVTSDGDTLATLAALVAAHLAAAGHRLAVFEALERTGDPHHPMPGVPYFTYGREVFHYLARYNRREKSIEEVILASRYYPFVGVLAELATTVQPIHVGDAVSITMLEQIAQGTEYLLIGAYDEEGAIIWSRRESS